jgi:predicted RNA-binding Zn ribbon-like protein
MDQHALPYDQMQLATAVDLVNTYDPWFAEPESLGDLEALARFLSVHGYGQPAYLDDADLARALTLRDRLRAVFSTEDLSHAVSALTGAMTGGRVKVEPTVLDTGRAALALTSDPDDPPIARLAIDTAIGLTRALERYGIERLRECAARPCQEAFVDASRNGARRFCSHRCANRTNVAAFRERRRAT